MTNTVAIKNYELTLPIGKDPGSNRIKIFTKSNNLRVGQINVEFSPSYDRNPLVQLLEGTSTGVRGIRIRLGENAILKFLDFLRNEKNRNLSFDLAPTSTAAFLGEIEGVSQTLRIFETTNAALHSTVTNRRRSPISQIFRPATRR